MLIEAQLMRFFFFIKYAKSELRHRLSAYSAGNLNFENIDMVKGYRAQGMKSIHIGEVSYHYHCYFMALMHFCTIHIEL